MSMAQAQVLLARVHGIVCLAFAAPLWPTEHEASRPPVSTISITPRGTPRSVARRARDVLDVTSRALVAELDDAALTS